jgi:hypothetical protein
MDSLERASALLNIKRMEKSNTSNPTQTTTISGTAASDSAEGKVTVNLGGDSVTYDDVQEIEANTSINVKKGDKVRITLVGADGTAKDPLVTDVVGGGDRQQEEINKTKNYFFHDDEGAHVTTKENDATTGANSLLTALEMQIRKGTVVVSSFGENEINLGKNSDSSVIKMCGNKGIVNYYKDSLQNGHLNLSNNSDTSTQKSYVEMSSTYGAKRGALGICADSAHAYVFGTADNIVFTTLDGSHFVTFTPEELLSVMGLRPVVLYSDSTGTNGTVTLSKSSANYTHMKIYYRDDGGRCGAQEVYIPNGKTISLRVLSGDSGQFFVNHGAFTIRGTTITPDSTYYGTFMHISSTDMGTHWDKLTMNHVIYITRVEAWGEVG